MPRLSRLAFVLAVAALAARPPTARAEDAEKATHGDEAATPQITHDVETNGVRVRQYQLGCLSQLTYLIVSKGEAAVIDPQRDVDHYLRDAKTLGAKVTHVFLTHTNADFVAGHTELARGGAKVHIAKESGSKFPHDGLVDGSKVAVGDATFEAWATPGHTLDSMCLLLHVPGATPDPLYVFTGDTLFIGGIGRPDLMGGDATPMRLASAAYDSIAHLKTLPAATKVLPAHGAGSLCGAHLSPETVSTIGDERRGNPYLASMSRAQFVSRVVSGLPVAPAYFKFNARLNRDGPPVIEGAPAMPPGLSPAEFKTHLDGGAWAVDLRDAKAYAAGHVEGSVNVAIRGRLDTWTGIVIPFDARLLLVGSDDEVSEATFRFRRIGLDKVDGHLKGGVAAWKAAGLPVRTTELWSPERLMGAMRDGTEPILVDVRTASEVQDVRIGDYANLPLSDWDRFGHVLDPKAPVLFVCNSAYRSSMAVGLAERQGFASVASLDGGVDAWLTAKLPTKGTARIAGAAVCTTPPPSDGADAPTSTALPPPRGDDGDGARRRPARPAEGLRRPRRARRLAVRRVPRPRRRARRARRDRRPREGPRPGAARGPRRSRRHGGVRRRRHAHRRGPWPVDPRPLGRHDRVLARRRRRGRRADSGGRGGRGGRDPNPARRDAQSDARDASRGPRRPHALRPQEAPRGLLSRDPERRSPRELLSPLPAAAPRALLEPLPRGRRARAHAPRLVREPGHGAWRLGRARARRRTGHARDRAEGRRRERLPRAVVRRRPRRAPLPRLHDDRRARRRLRLGPRGATHAPAGRARAELVRSACASRSRSWAACSRASERGWPAGARRARR